VKYWLHPEAREDLREAAEFYRDNAGVALSQSVLAEFEHSVNLLLEHPPPRQEMAIRQAPSRHEALSLLGYLCAS